MNRTKIAYLIFTVAFSIGALSQESYSLKYHWNTGQVIKTKVSVISSGITKSENSEITIPTGLRNSMIIVTKVISIDDKSNAKVQITFEKYNLEMNGSDMSPMIDKTKMPIITATYDSYGNLLGKAEIKGPKNAVDPSKYLNGLPLFGIVLPDHPIKVGDSWSKDQEVSISNILADPKLVPKTRMNYKLIALESHSNLPCYKIQLKFLMPTIVKTDKTDIGSPLQINGQNDGTSYFWVDRQTLEVLECTGTSITDMKVRASSEGTSKPTTMEMHLQSNIKMEKLDNLTDSDNETPKEVTTASGLKYIDKVVGDGAAPKKGDTVVVTYVGTFRDGKKFDASADHEGTFEFTLGLGQVIKGWDEGVATMHVGGTRVLTVPANLAYGEQGNGPIPGGATLIFEIKLVNIK